MKIGDIVRFTESVKPRYGIVTFVDDSHRQHFASVLFSEGLRKRIWEGHLEVVSEKLQVH